MVPSLMVGDREGMLMVVPGTDPPPAAGADDSAAAQQQEQVQAYIYSPQQNLG